jgi:hypothetical protein
MGKKLLILFVAALSIILARMDINLLVAVTRFGDKCFGVLNATKTHFEGAEHAKSFDS